MQCHSIHPLLLAKCWSQESYYISWIQTFHTALLITKLLLDGISNYCSNLPHHHNTITTPNSPHFLPSLDVAFSNQASISCWNRLIHGFVTKAWTVHLDKEDKFNTTTWWSLHLQCGLHVFWFELWSHCNMTFLHGRGSQLKEKKQWLSSPPSPPCLSSSSTLSETTRYPSTASNESSLSPSLSLSLSKKRKDDVLIDNYIMSHDYSTVLWSSQQQETTERITTSIKNSTAFSLTKLQHPKPVFKLVTIAEIRAKGKKKVEVAMPSMMW